MSPGAARPPWLVDAPSAGDRSSLPAHARIEQWLTEVITRGDLVPGDRLPGEQELAALLGVSRMTLRQALGRLESLGTVIRRTGRGGGTFISEPRIECDLTGLAGFTEQMRRANLRAGARVISTGTAPATAALAGALSVARSDQVHEVIRVRTANREPLALERTYLPAAPFPDLLEHGLTGSLYDLLARRYGQLAHTAVESLESVIAREDEAALLRVAPGAPLMLIERTVYTAAGMAIEYARDLFRSDRIKISLRVGLGGTAR